MTPATLKASAPEDIVVSPEWARKLKEAGYPQEDSAFVLHDVDGVNGVIAARGTHKTYMLYDTAMPTAEEVLRRLPKMITGSSRALWLTCVPDLEQWKVTYESSDVKDDKKRIWQTEDTLANAAAAMFVYLKENNLMPDA